MMTMSGCGGRRGTRTGGFKAERHGRGRVGVVGVCEERACGVISGVKNCALRAWMALAGLRK